MFIGLLLVLITLGDLYLLIPRLLAILKERKEWNSYLEMQAIRAELGAHGINFAPDVNIQTTTPLLSGQDWIRKLVSNLKAERQAAEK